MLIDGSALICLAQVMSSARVCGRYIHLEHFFFFECRLYSVRGACEASSAGRACSDRERCFL